MHIFDKKGMLLKHFSNWKPESIDQTLTYSTSWEYSNYWINKLSDTGQMQNQAASLVNSVHALLRHFNTEIDLTSISGELQKTKYYSELLKEFIFEDVRANEFPDKPSRKKCMFLLPLEVDASEYAERLGYNITERIFLEIEPHSEACFHFADLTLLNCNQKTHQEKVEAARQYWQGTTERNFNTEILLTGQFQVKKVASYQ